jgi:uncharacterized membrane protein
MRTIRKITFLGVVVFWCTMFALGQTAASCSYTVFQYPGATATIASGINHYNTVVGSASDSHGVTFGFIRWANGTFTKVMVPGSVETDLRSRNDKGVNVGTYNDSNGSHGFIQNGNNFQTVDVSGQPNSALRGINNYGSTVGFDLGSTSEIGFKRWANGDLVKVQYPGQSQTQADGINDSGVVVGTVNAESGPGNMFGFASTASIKRLTILMLASLSTFVSDINNSQIIVGTGYNLNAKPRGQAFRIINGKVQRLPIPSGADLAEAYGINKDGVIVGDADFSGTRKGYIAHCQ